MSSCNFLASFGPPPDGIDVDDPDDGCESDNDCIGDDLCLAGTCRDSCLDNGDCSGALGVCDTRLGICAECVDEGQCDEGESCALGRCTDGCQENADCNDGFICDGNGVCVAVECTSDEDCEGECINNQCEGSTCEPVGARCEGNVLVRCDGQSESRQECEAGCDANQNRCRVPQQICEPNNRACRNARELGQCNEQGTAIETIEICEEGITTCMNDECVEIQCEPQCAQRECGEDPRCGQSCGQCADNEVCTPEGRCLNDVDPPVANQLRFELTWDADVDLDLHLVRNGGELCDRQDDCYYITCAAPGAPWGNGVTTGNPILEADSSRRGPEVIVFNNPGPGEYSLNVIVFSMPDDVQTLATLVTTGNGIPLGTLNQELQSQGEVWRAGSFTINQQGFPSLVLDGNVEQTECR